MRRKRNFLNFVELSPNIHVKTMEERISDENGKRYPTSDQTRPVSLTRFFGKKDPKVTRKFEQPWQRAAAWMWASGTMSLAQIAEAVDRDGATVRQLARVPWFQETVHEIMKENGADDIMALFRAESQNSLLTLIEIRDDKKAPASTRSATALAILHQTLGKPTQRVEMEAAVKSSDPVAEVRRLEEENARLQRTPCASNPPARRVNFFDVPSAGSASDAERLAQI